MRIGILGGTFNPIHKGHLALAEAAISQLGLGKIIFIPTYIPPHKNILLASAEDRYNVVKLAIKGKAKFSISDLEIKRRCKSYTIETLRSLKKKFGPGAELFFITGADSLKELPKWHKFNEVLGLVTFVVAARPGYTVKGAPSGIEILKMRPVAISSTRIRKLLKNGKSIKRFVPLGVAEYIYKKKLYT